MRLDLTGTKVTGTASPPCKRRCRSAASSPTLLVTR